MLWGVTLTQSILWGVGVPLIERAIWREGFQGLAWAEVMVVLTDQWVMRVVLMMNLQVVVTVRRNPY